MYRPAISTVSAAPRAAFGVPLLGLALLAGPLLAQQQQQQRTPPLPIATFTLDNGLRFIVSEDHSTPIVAVNVYYYVGSGRERAGRSGFAHLFEHMLFQETKHLDKGEFNRQITQAGGTSNGTTSEDRTMYFEIVPSNRLNLALWMEADRLANLVVTDANFKREREVVKEERRLRVENQPYAGSILRLDTLATDYPPYKHTVIGSMDDLNAATAEDVRTFHDEYYVPNNATIALVGDVTLDEVKQMAQKYFAWIPRGAAVGPLPPPTPTPHAGEERRLRVEDRMANLPLYYAAYAIPPHSAHDTYALDLLSKIFSQGESSRLNQRLVKQEKAAVQVFSGLNSRYGPGALVFGALPNQGVPIERIESLIDDEIQKLETDGVTERELQKAKNQTLADQVRQRSTVLSKSVELQQALFLEGDASAVNRDLQQYMDVTVQDIVDVARKYLVPGNRSVLITVPAGEKADASPAKDASGKEAR